MRHDNAINLEVMKIYSSKSSGYLRFMWSWKNSNSYGSIQHCHGERRFSASISSPWEWVGEKWERSRREKLRILRHDIEGAVKSKRISRRLSLRYDIIICSQFVLHTPPLPPPPQSSSFSCCCRFGRNSSSSQAATFRTACVCTSKVSRETKIDIHTWFNKTKTWCGKTTSRWKVIRQRYDDDTYLHVHDTSESRSQNWKLPLPGEPPRCALLLCWLLCGKNRHFFTILITCVRCSIARLTLWKLLPAPFKNGGKRTNFDFHTLIKLLHETVNKLPYCRFVPQRCCHIEWRNCRSQLEMLNWANFSLQMFDIEWQTI